MRCRLVARDYKDGADPDLYAGTPPLEALKLILSRAATGTRTKCIMVNDVSRAYLHAPCRAQVFVQRCAEDLNHWYGDPAIDNAAPGATCWRLRRSMYGTRLAAQDWQAEVTKTLEGIGFTRSRASPNTFWHKARDIWTFCHGDDFASCAEPENLSWLYDRLQEKWLMKSQVLGPKPGDCR